MTFSGTVISVLPNITIILIVVRCSTLDLTVAWNDLFIFWRRSFSVGWYNNYYQFVKSHSLYIVFAFAIFFFTIMHVKIYLNDIITARVVCHFCTLSRFALVQPRFLCIRSFSNPNDTSAGTVTVHAYIIILLSTMSIIMYTYNTILQLCQYVTEATAAAIVVTVFSQAQE